MICTKCKADKSPTEFSGTTWCKSCWKLYNTSKRNERKNQGLCTRCGKNEPVEGKLQCLECRDKNNTAIRKLKQRVIDHYGGKCNYCGELRFEFLCIDHINNNGTEHRKQFKDHGGGKEIYLWLHKNDYPDGFQLLCHNCNLEKSRKNPPRKITTKPKTGVIQVCSRCKQEKDTSEFYWRGNRNRTNYHCKECNTQTNTQKGVRTRELVFEHYGSVCECCGETNQNFLTVDHINGGGKKHKFENKISDIYRWLVKNNFPDGFRLLCMNCNEAIFRFGKCPHTP